MSRPIGKRLLGLILSGARGYLDAVLQPLNACGEVFQNSNFEQFDLVEMCCSTISSLTEVATSQQLRSCRLTLETGFDFDKNSSEIEAKKFISSHAVKRGWSATPCTLCSSLQGWNWHKWDGERRKQFLQDRLKARRLNRRVLATLLHLLSRGPDQHVYVEWPRHNGSWKTPEYQWFANIVKNVFRRRLYTVLFDGCAFGLKNHQGLFVNKPWRIDTTDELLAVRLNGKFCPGGHEHVPAYGRTARESAFYPPALVKKVVASFLESDRKSVRAVSSKYPAEVQQSIARGQFAMLRLPSRHEEKPTDPVALVKIQKALLQCHVGAGHVGKTTLKNSLKGKVVPAV